MLHDSAVNREVGGSSPSLGAKLVYYELFTERVISTFIELRQITPTFAEFMTLSFDRRANRCTTTRLFPSWESN